MAKKTYTDKELMQMAIDVMNQSVNEPRPDGKVPPKVGAVLLFPDGRIETAYRGELREGDHAAGHRQEELFVCRITRSR